MSETAEYWRDEQGNVHFNVDCAYCGIRNKYGDADDLGWWTCGGCSEYPTWAYVRDLEAAILGVLEDGDLKHLHEHNPVKRRKK